MTMCEKCESHCSAKVFVRLAHTALCVGVPVSLLFKNTVLSAALFHGQYLVVSVLYTALLVFSLTMYFMACCTDPGYLRVRKHWKQQSATVNQNNNRQEGEEEEGWDCDDEGSNMLRFNTEDGDFKYRMCDYCEIQQPMRTKHCEDCGRCVRKYDHHCPWLEACIGERNHKFFWLFLLSTAVLIACTFYIAWEGMTYQPQWGLWLKTNALLLVDMLVLLVSGLVVGGLLSFHTFLMLRGLTTWEAASRERITYLRYLDEDYNPFNEGLCHNAFHFLCSCRTRKWEGVYASHAQINGSLA